MDEEVSISVKIAVLLCLTAALLSTVIVVFMNSDDIMDLTQNKSIEAKAAVTTQNITRLQNEPRRYIDIYKTYEYFEESINSIYGVELDSAKTHILYLRNADYVNSESPLSAVCATNGWTGVQNIDNMYSNFLYQFCDEEHSADYISIKVYPDKLGLGWDIYYEVLDR